MAEKISTEFRKMKPYISKEVDKTMARRGLRSPATAQGTVVSAPGVWTLNDGSDLNDGLLLNP